MARKVLTFTILFGLPEYDNGTVPVIVFIPEDIYALFSRDRTSVPIGTFIGNVPVFKAIKIRFRLVSDDHCPDGDRCG